MKKIISIVSAFLIALFIVGCGAAKLTPAQQAVVDSKTELYTQVTMWTEKGRIIGTNYSVGELIPVNSKVTILAINSKVIVFEYKGSKIKYEVYSKYTKVDSGAMLDRLFGKSKVDLSKLSPATKKNVLNGVIAKGMTKKVVLMARGYPPFHVTKGIESNTWKYWRNRWVTADVIFTNGVVTQLKGNAS